MPQFLEREYFYGFTKEQINKSDNIVSISWLIYFLMHLTRLIEYAQLPDESALTVIVKQKSQKDSQKNLTIESWNPFKPFAKNALEIFKADMLQNYAQFEQNLAKSINKRARTSASKRMYLELRKVLIRYSRWCYVNPLNPNETKEFL